MKITKRWIIDNMIILCLAVISVVGMYFDKQLAKKIIKAQKK